MPSPNTLTREELYDLVWSAPMRTLAKQFGISDVALGKRCRAADIPLPGPGHWAKKDAGKPIVQPKLPTRKLGQAREVEFGRKDAYGPRYTDEEVLGMVISPPVPFADGLPEVIARARIVVGTLRTPRSLDKPHPLIGKLIQADEARRDQQTKSGFSFPETLFDSPFEKRRLRLMNAIFLALSKAGGACSISGKDAQHFGVSIGDTRLGLTLTTAKDYGHLYRPKDLPADEKMKLSLSWYQPPPEITTEWLDAKDKKLEDQLQDIVVNLFTYAEWSYRHSIKRQYEWLVERKLEVERRISEEKKAKAKRELQAIEKAAKEQLNKLIEEATAWRLAADLRGYIEARITHSAQNDSEELRAWVEWARGIAASVDPLTR